MEWRYEVTRERLAAATAPLAEAMQRQACRPVPVWRARLDVALWVANLAVVIAALVRRRNSIDGWPWHLWLWLALVVLMLVVSLRPAWYVAWRQRVSRRHAARRAARLIAETAADAPRTIRYELSADALRGWTEPGGVAYVTRFKHVRHLVSSRDAVFLFERRATIIPTRMVHVSTPEQRDGLVAAFVARGASHERLEADEPVVASLPQARLR